MTTASPQSPGSQAPLLIAVAGLGPRVGTTTTAVALACAWPGREAALVVEADPAGGQLADMVGADPYLGLASLARILEPDAEFEKDRVLEHLQFLPNAVPMLAAPPGRDPARTALTTALLTGAHPGWRGLGATVFADCGVPEPDSGLAPVLEAADACLVVVRPEYTEPELAAHRILRLTAGCRRRGIVLIEKPRSEFAAALALPILGSLPAAPVSAEALLHGTRQPRRGPRLLPAARTIATAVREQLRPPHPVANAPHRRTHPPTRPHMAPARRQAPPPTVYRLDPATTAVGPRPSPNPRTEAATVRTPPAPAPVRVPPPGPTTPGRAAQQTSPPGQDRATDPPAAPHRFAPSSPPPASPAPKRSEPGLAIKVFGPTRLLWRAPGREEAVDVTSRLQPRSRALLTVLALHPEGITRAALIELLWDERAPERSGHALTNTLSRLRTTVAAATDDQVTALLSDDRTHCRLSEDGITVDYREFAAAVASRRRATADEDQAVACRTIAQLATTTLAADLTDAAWVEPLREAARRDTRHALSWLARNADLDPRATLGLLETAVDNDPYNETLWHHILRLHARLGEYDALASTYSLLTHRLAEIGETPSRETHRLLEGLRKTAE
ncbi:BTAD domain-containing putative transcriptional regulator [Nocardia asiatica]|uniref:BTAD domain-containing putative transcriptional regulator n=1 Tax=Nocardia asiatica TaxID=209252 RepID=UPI00245885AD|nr:BTAD domain-containing putative transcriptional regulator [Nocardia asiatica]